MKNYRYILAICTVSVILLSILFYIIKMNAMGEIHEHDDFWDNSYLREMDYVSEKTYKILLRFLQEYPYDINLQTGKNVYGNHYFSMLSDMKSFNSGKNEVIIDGDIESIMAIYDKVFSLNESDDNESVMFYYLDFDGDGVSELGVTDKRTFIYVLDYDENTNKIYIKWDLSSTWYGILGINRVYWDNEGTNIQDTILDESAEVIREVDFFERQYSESESIFLVGIPKDVVISKWRLRKQAYHFENDNVCFFRIDEDEYEEMTKPYFEAEKRANEKMKGLRYSYDEILSILKR